jgi:hypothetical protein
MGAPGASHLGTRDSKTLALGFRFSFDIHSGLLYAFHQCHED